MSTISFRILAAALVLGSAMPAFAQTANSSGGAGSATQALGNGTAPSGGNTASGSANGQNAQVSSGGATAGTSKIGAPTAVERQEQRKSDQDTKMICKGC